MSTTVPSNGGLCSVPSRVCPTPHVWSCLSGRGRLCRHKSPTVPWQGFTGRHASSWPAKASRLQVKCKCMVSDPQDRRAADSKTLVLLNSINDSAKWVVTLSAGGVLVWHHNIDVSWSLLGSIVTVFLCKVHKGPAGWVPCLTYVNKCLCMCWQALKKLINAQRPRYAKKTDPGMPSSHASSMAYLSVYMAIAWHPEQHLLADLGLVLAAFLVSFCTTVLHVNQKSIESNMQ